MAIAASIRIQITEGDDGWKGRALPMTREDHWGLLVLGNPSVLRFPDGSSFDVGIRPSGSDSGFDVWEWDAHEKHLQRCPACGGAISHTSVEDNSGQDLSGAVVVTERCGNCGAERRTAHRLKGLNG